MGILNWFRGITTEQNTDGSQDTRNNPKKISDIEFTAIGNTEPICPYCDFKFDKMPLKKKQCPNCHNFIRSKTRPLDNRKVLIKEDQMDELERQWFVKNGNSHGSIRLGATPEVKQQLSEKLANQIEGNSNQLKGLSIESEKKVKKIVADGIRFEKNLGQISHEIVEQVDGVNLERARSLINTITMKSINSEARDRYKKTGIKKLERLVARDEKTCDKCAALDGKIFTLEEAAKIDAEAHEGCRCTWIAVTDLD
ncbi:MAG: minor capsid protein [Methanoregula sp.]